MTREVGIDPPSAERKLIQKPDHDDERKPATSDALYGVGAQRPAPQRVGKAQLATRNNPRFRLAARTSSRM